MQKPRIIIALDYPDAGAANVLLEQLDPARCRLKVDKGLNDPARANISVDCVHGHGRIGGKNYGSRDSLIIIK